MKGEELKLAAVKTEQRMVVLHFTPQQLTERRKELVDLAIQLMKEEDAWKETKAGHDSIVKPIREAMNLRTREVHRGFEEKEAMCFLVPDQEAGEMNYILEDGTIALRRPLYPEERQLNLLTQVKEG